VSFNIAGGTHHAFTDHGEAFACWMIKPLLLNFYWIINWLKNSNHRFRRASRNGTAEIFQNNPMCSRFLRMAKPIIHSKKKLLI
jgi:hypothetical protein